MILKERLTKYARLIVRQGANVQKDQRLVIRGSVEAKDFIRLLVEEGYLAGAKQVHVLWGDEYVSHDTYKYATLETLQIIPTWQVDQYKFFVEEKAAFISITSPIPGLNADLDGKKIQQASLPLQKEMMFFQNFMMANHSQWTVVGVPNTVWAEKVFPNLKGEEAVLALWEAILNSSRVYEDSNPLDLWEEHNKQLVKQNELLNKHNFDHLIFTNSLGTNLKVGLAKSHLWAGGMDTTTSGILFNPNIPTEETFSMPHRDMTEGRVVATKPLNFQGKLIEGFWLEFKDGKVIDFDAKKEKDALAQLLSVDEGASYIGEIALIEDDSPINNMDILFYNTLYDENASCHMALGKAYPFNIINGSSKSLDELKELGYNDSMVHVDFMFGSSDMNIVGVKQDGTRIQVFSKGKFVIE